MPEELLTHEEVEQRLQKQQLNLPLYECAGEEMTIIKDKNAKKNPWYFVIKHQRSGLLGLTR